jgi:ADP-heptose:LPS heptosyltransferase
VAVFPRSRKFRREDKNWSEEKYLAAITYIQANLGLKVAVLGTPQESYFAIDTPGDVLDLINVPNDLRMEIQTTFLNRCLFSFGAMSGATLYALACNSPTVIFGECNQAERYYEENFLGTPLMFLPSLDPSISWVQNALKSMYRATRATRGGDLEPT